MEKIIELTDVNKSYDKNHKALENMNLNVYENDIFGLVGSNGAGKSTILKLLSGAILKDSGHISILGNSDDDLIKSFSKMGFLIENPLFYDELSGMNNLIYLCKLRGMKIDNALEIAKEFGIYKHLSKKVKSYSTGMRQRLGLVAAFMAKPKIILLDEPINGLDPEGITFLRNYLLKINKSWQSTIIISSHILNELSLIATRYAFIKDGKLIEEISKEEFEDKSKQFISIELEKEDLEKATALLEMKFNVKDYKVYPDGELRIYENFNTKDLQKFLVENAIFLKSIKVKEKSLEEYYLERVGENND